MTPVFHHGSGMTASASRDGGEDHDLAAVGQGRGQGLEGADVDPVHEHVDVAPEPALLVSDPALEGGGGGGHRIEEPAPVGAGAELEVEHGPGPRATPPG